MARVTRASVAAAAAAAASRGVIPSTPPRRTLRSRSATARATANAMADSIGSKEIQKQKGQRKPKPQPSSSPSSPPLSPPSGPPPPRSTTTRNRNPKRKRSRPTIGNSAGSDGPSLSSPASHTTDIRVDDGQNSRQAVAPALTREEIQTMVHACIGAGYGNDNDDGNDDHNNGADPATADTYTASGSNSSISSNHPAPSTVTRGGWCLVDALTHCATVSDGILAPLIRAHGPPRCYLDYLREQHKQQRERQRERYPRSKQPRCNADSEDADDAHSSFRSLCRIVSGQQLAGAAANTIWRRLLETVGATEEDPSALTPERILSFASGSSNDDDDDASESEQEERVEMRLRKPAGLSRAKCRCILAIAERFSSGDLSDDLLMGAGTDADNDSSSSSGIEDVRSRLLSVKGLGPWSVDMFLLFHCHRSDVLPLGDLAVRNGTAVLWKLSPSGSGGKGKAGGSGSGNGSPRRTLCAKKDAGILNRAHEPFAPYRSISSHYMYRVVGDLKTTGNRTKDASC